MGLRRGWIISISILFFAVETLLPTHGAALPLCQHAFTPANGVAAGKWQLKYQTFGIHHRSAGFGQDVSWFRFKRGGRLVVVDAVSGQRRSSTPVSSSFSQRHIAMTPDSSKFVWSEDQNRVVVTRTSDAAQFEIVRPHPVGARPVFAMNRRGNLLAVGRGRSDQGEVRIEIWDLSEPSPRLVRETKVKPSRFERWGLGGPGSKHTSISQLSFSHDDAYLAVNDNRRSVRLLDVQTNSWIGFMGADPITARLGWTPSHFEIVPSPFAPLFASMTWNKPLLTLFDSRTGRIERILEGATEMPHHIQFHPDGRRVLASANGQAHIWDIESGVLVKTLGQSTQDQAIHYKFTSDGTHVAGVDTEGSAVIWDLADDTRPLKFTIPKNLVPFGASLHTEVSPNGKQILVSARGPQMADDTLFVFELKLTAHAEDGTALRSDENS